MAWPTNSSNIDTQHLDAGTDSPASARANIKTALDELANVIDGRNQASGVAGLDASSKISATQIPDELNSTSATDLTLDPATGKINIEEILQMKPQTLAQLNARSDKEEGDLAYCSNGNSGSKCLAVYDGSNWKVVALGATIS
jgi:hypothetical protein|tara:strand:+ start:1526 stop:1954 length:429 start_codon:yes stop_codon:yes gene_type:complete